MGTIVDTSKDLIIVCNLIPKKVSPKQCYFHIYLIEMSIKQLLAGFQNGSLSAVELCQRCIQRTKQFSYLNAFITTSLDTAEKSAKQSEISVKSGKKIGCLEGIPIAIKDNFCTKDLPTTCASKMLENFHPPYNATVVQKLIDNGAVIIGKTNMDEFAMGSGSVDSIFGPVKNPWNYVSTHQLNEGEVSSGNWHVAGGSSGGSAVAVAAGMAVAALGSDTGGSTRNPSSYCGVVSLKPTYGLLSRHGLIPLVNSLDVPGIITRTVEDVSVILNVLAGHDINDSTTVTDKYAPVNLPSQVNVNGLTVGIPQEYHAPGLSTDVLSHWEHVSGLLHQGGADIKHVSLPHTQYSIACYAVLCAAEVASNMARYDGIEFGFRGHSDLSTTQLYAETRHEGFNEVVRGRILAGNYFLLKENYEKYFLQAQRIRRLITEDFAKVFGSGGVDMLLTPIVLSDAPRYSDFTQLDNRSQCEQQDIFTQPTNLAGLPAICIPVGLSSRGLPIGLQLIGRPFSEHSLLETAAWLEEKLQFTMFNPDLLETIDTVSDRSYSIKTS